MWYTDNGQIFPKKDADSGPETVIPLGVAFNSDRCVKKLQKKKIIISVWVKLQMGTGMN